MNKKKSPAKGPHFNFAMFMVTLFAAGLVWLLCSGIYDLLETWPGVFRVPLVLALFLLLMGAIVLIVSKMSRSYCSDVITGKIYPDRTVLYLLLGTVISFVIMMPLELLYELRITAKEEYNASTYIFIVDDSGSMDSNDPDVKRYDAIRSIMASKPADNQFAVYAFGSDVSQVLPMSRVGDGIPELKPVQSGGTAMGAALDQVIGDVEQGVLGTFANPAAILITDGHAGDISMGSELDALLQRYVAKGIPVNTIGMGWVDRRMLNHMASSTGGTFVGVERATGLYDAVEQAALGSSYDLLSFRPELTTSWLHAIMRVLFIGIYAAMFTCMMIICYGDSRSAKFSLCWGIGKGILAAVLLEVGLNALMWHESTTCLICMVIIGVLFARKDEAPQPQKEKTSFFEEDDPLFGDAKRIMY